MTKKKVNRIYIYPITARGKDESQNPYVYNLTSAISLHSLVVNKNDPSKNGILQLFRYFFKTDVIYFNWIENLPDKKGGYIQSALLILILWAGRLANKKIIWTMHNKISHSKTHLKLKTFLFKVLLKKAHLIITHSKEGVEYAKSIYPKGHAVYFPHPVLSSEIKNGAIIRTTEKDYDILIWGLMSPYKGIVPFLEYLYEHQIDKYRILIAGKFVSDYYYREAKHFKPSGTEIQNRFVERDELNNLINKSKSVLFTYQNTSVLSSGVLMDTLARRATIIGPNAGSFKDLAAENLAFSYQGYEQLMDVLDKVCTQNRVIEKEKIDAYLNTITWNQFSHFVDNQISTT
jgi:hypothetical protein